MDDDSIVEPDALESVVNKAEKINNNFSFISSLVKWIDNSYCLMNKVTFNNDVILKKYELIKDNMLAIKSASFVGCFINLEIAKKIGLPIKEFFIYADDIEYTLRLSAQNTGYFNSDSVIIHKMSNNVTSEIHCVDESKINRYFYDFRNNVYILLKTKKIIKGFLLSMWRYLKYIIKIIKYEMKYNLKGKK